MTWTKLSDDFADDCWTLSDKALRLHVEGLIWSNRKLLDQRVPKDDVRRFAKHPDAVPELVDGGWWLDVGDAYVIRHHASYQQTREDVLARQERARRNGAKSAGRPPKAPRERFVECRNGTQVETDVGYEPGLEDGADWPVVQSRTRVEEPTSVSHAGSTEGTQRDRTGRAGTGSTDDSAEASSWAPWDDVEVAVPGRPSQEAVSQWADRLYRAEL